MDGRRVVGRFAPSPSGRMHLGNVFAALMAWCGVRSCGGRLLLRMEDLDTERCSDLHAAQLREDLRWLGLDWDEETPQQSLRTEIYEAQLAKLEAQGVIYPCWCTRGMLKAASAPHASDGRVIYPGTCRNLTPEERAMRPRKAALRLLVPDAVYAVEDGVQGHYEENLARDCGDFPVRRADGVFAYQLAVVVDDGLCGINQVVRGADLLSSTPRQLYLQKLLGFPAPEYYHVPLLIGPDGRRLSKRDRDLDLGVLQQRMTASQLIGMLAHAAGLTETAAPISAAELAGIFDWRRVRQGPIVVQTE